MSIRALLDLLGGYPWLVSLYFVLPPLCAWLLGQVNYDRVGRVRAWDYVYSVLVYLVAIPGTIAAVLVGYALFIARTNLLHVNALVYFLPLLSMAVTFVLISRRVTFDHLPGFGRLSGLMMLIGLSFLVVLILHKTRILVGFFGSLESLLVLGVLLFVAFQYAAAKLGGKADKNSAG